MDLIRSSIYTLSIVCGFTAANADMTGIRKGTSTRMPESYNTFFPTKAPPTGQALIVDGQARSESLVANTRKRGPAHAPAAADGNLYGYLYYYNNDALEQGFYKINPATGEGRHLWTDEFTQYTMAMNGGWLRDGRLCGFNTLRFMGGVMAYAYVEFDFNTGATQYMRQLEIDASNMLNIYLTTAYRESDDRIYGYGYDETGEGFVFKSAPADEVESPTVITSIGDNLSKMCSSICYNAQEDLFYGVTPQGMFVSVDCRGKMTELFNVNLPNQSTAITGMAYSPATGKYVWNVYFTDGSSAMYNIDPVNERADIIASLPSGENYIFMLDTQDNVAPDAPAVATLKACDFKGAATEGSMTFTLPAQTYAGDPLSGTLEWDFAVDGQVVKSGTAPAGTDVKVDVSVPTNTKYVFSFISRKDGKKSMPVTERRWIGADNPLPPANVRLTTSSLTWDAVSGSVHDGFVDYPALTYTVYINDEKICETSATQIDVKLPENKPFTSYTAYVTAAADGMRSEQGVSNYITYGDPLELTPNIHYRPEEKELELFTALNLDGKTDSEGKDLTWRFTTDMGFPAFASGYDGDDWLMFPPIYFDDPTKAYLYEMEVGLVHDRDTSGTVSVYIGKEPTPEAMTQVIIPEHHCEHMLGDIIKKYFAVTEAGTYYIGIHCITHEVSFHVSDIDISRTNESSSLPMPVSDFTATPASDGALKASVAFTFPSKTVNGIDIAPSTEITATVTSRTTTPGSMATGEIVDTKTLTGKPGESVSTEIATAQNYNIISAVCSIDGQTGSAESAVIYTGVVRPYLVQNLQSSVSEDNMSMTLTWDPPVEGEEDGAIGSDFLYTVWYYNNGWSFGADAGWNTSEFTYTLPEGADLQWVRLGIMAYNAAGQSDHVSATTQVIGTPYVLPMIETLKSGMESYGPIMILRPTEEYSASNWMVDNPGNVSPIFANDSGIAYIGFATEGSTNVKSRLSLPKFSTRSMSDVVISLTYFGGYNNMFAADMSLSALCYGLDEPTKIGDLPKGNKWITNSLPLPATFNEKDWVELYIDSDLADDQKFAMFSGYSISGTSGVEGVSDGKGYFSSTPGMLHAIGFKGQHLVVSDLSGRVLVNVAALDDMNGFVLAPGIYIASTGTQSVKVVIK